MAENFLPGFLLSDFGCPDCSPSNFSRFDCSPSDLSPADFLPVPHSAPDADLRLPLPPPSRPDRERLKLILIGSAAGIQEMIYRLQQCQIAEVGDWSRLLPAPHAFTPDPSEAMSILVLYRRRSP